VGHKTILLFVFLALSFLSAKEYQLYYLGGQSNMEGFGFKGTLPQDLQEPLSDVLIFTGNMTEDKAAAEGLGIWAPLQPGFGTGFRSDGMTNWLSGRFGPELTFAHRMRELNPDLPIAIVKYSRGGSSLALDASGYGTWDPDYEDEFGMNQYDHFLKTLTNALNIRDIDGDGEDDTLIPAGIVWMQGEADAYDSREAALRYEANLKRMMDLARAALRVDDLPVVIGEIADSGMDDDGKMMDFLEIVQQGQAGFVKNDPNAALIKTSDLAFSNDKWHYTTEGYLTMGRRFADEMHRLQRNFQRGSRIYADIMNSKLPWQVIGRSTEKRRIVQYVYGSGSKTVLIFGGFHGDEQLGVELVHKFAEYIHTAQPRLQDTRVIIVPVLNPDGLIRNTRMNVNGVDVNRNFPTENWESTARSRRTNPGPGPGSEIETKLAINLVKSYKPLRIVSVHTPLEVVNYDGPAKKLAQRMAAHNGYLVKGDIGYPTPGSFGTWVGKEQQIPSITLELPRGTINKVWEPNRDALLEVITFKPE